MNRLEIAVRLMASTYHMSLGDRIGIGEAFEVADKILSHHEQTKPKQGPDKGMDALGSVGTVTATELKLRQRYERSEQAIKNIDKMKDALTAEEFENWMGNEPWVISRRVAPPSRILECSFKWSESNQGDAYWHAIFNRLWEQEN